MRKSTWGYKYLKTKEVKKMVENDIKEVIYQRNIFNT